MYHVKSEAEFVGSQLGGFCQNDLYLGIRVALRVA